MKPSFSKTYDVVVVGGGVAGVAAAMAASRNGARVALMEKTVFLGGLATAGMINVYLPLCDGNGRQVSAGICEELLKASLKYGPGSVPQDWREQRDAKEERRYRCVFSPASMTLALDEALEKERADVWLDTLVCGADVDKNGRLRAVSVENSGGRGKIRAGCFVDASGDAVVARRAGVPVEFCENRLSAWSLEHERGGASWNTLSPGVNMLTTGNKERIFTAPDGKMVSQFVLESRKLIRARYTEAYESGKAERFNIYPLSLPAMPQFRKVAAIKGCFTLSDGMHGVFQKDSIGMAADWRKSGLVWEIPYWALLPKKVCGLLAAGRCISSVGDAWEITRVIPAAAVTGEAAGTAAAMALSKGVAPDKLPVAELQEKLRLAGNLLHLSDVGL